MDDNVVGPAVRSDNVHEPFNRPDEHTGLSRFCGDGNSRVSRLSDFVAISAGQEKSRDDDDDDEEEDPSGRKTWNNDNTDGFSSYSSSSSPSSSSLDCPKAAVNKELLPAAPKAVNTQAKQETHSEHTISSSLASAAAAAATTTTMEDMKELMHAAQIMMNIKPVTGPRGNGKRSGRTKEATGVKQDEFTKTTTTTTTATTTTTESPGSISSLSSLPKVTISLPVQPEPKIRKRRGPLAGGVSIFSAEDDRRLIEVVHDSAFQGNEHRHQRSATSGSLRVGVNWVLISKEIFQGRFTPRGLRNRYVRTLHPNLKHEPWTEDEDQKLMELATKNGNKWTLISGEFNNTRSDWMCKRRYLQLKKQIQTKEGALPAPDMKSQTAENVSVGANGDEIEGSISDGMLSQDTPPSTHEPLAKRAKYNVLESSSSPISPLTSPLFTKTQSVIISQLFPAPQIGVKEKQSEEPGQADQSQQHLWKQIQHHADPRYMSQLKRPLVIVCPPDQLSTQPPILHAVSKSASLVEQTNEATKRFMKEQLTEIQPQSKGHILTKVTIMSEAHVCAIHVVPLDIEMSFDQLLVELSKRFAREILQSNARLQYIGRDGDVVDLKNSEEWTTMKQEFFTMLSSDPSTRLQILVHI